MFDVVWCKRWIIKTSLPFRSHQVNPMEPIVLHFMHTMLDRLTTQCCGRSLDWKNKTRPQLYGFIGSFLLALLFDPRCLVQPQERARSLPANYTRPLRAERDVFNIIYKKRSLRRDEHKTALTDWLPLWLACVYFMHQSAHQQPALRMMDISFQIRKLSLFQRGLSSQRK